MSLLRVQPNLSRRAAARQPRASVRAHAVDGMYNHIVPNMDYVNKVVDAFPDAAVANPDEARVRNQQCCVRRCGLAGIPACDQLFTPQLSDSRCQWQCIFATASPLFCVCSALQQLPSRSAHTHPCAGIVFPRGIRHSGHPHERRGG